MELNLLMIDDHAAIIEGYKAILSLSKKKYVLKITTAFDCESAYKVITQHHDIAFDVVFVDITLPPYAEKKLHSGVDLVALIRAHMPQTKIIVLTSHTEKIVIDQIVEKAIPKVLC